MTSGSVTVKANEVDAGTATTSTGETVIGNTTAGTDDEAIHLSTTTCGITLAIADEKNLVMGNTAVDAHFTVAASATPGSEDIRMINTHYNIHSHLQRLILQMSKFNE